jgi:hypothetical protein
MRNATGMGEPVYRRLGFEKIGAGTSWWLDTRKTEGNAGPAGNLWLS